MQRICDSNKNTFVTVYDSKPFAIKNNYNADDVIRGVVTVKLEVLGPVHDVSAVEVVKSFLNHLVNDNGVQVDDVIQVQYTAYR